MSRFVVTYLDTEGETDTLIIDDAEDANDAEEAARGELTDRSPSIDTDEWEIVSIASASVPRP